MSGGAGSDRYVFSAGDGEDVIDNAGSSAGQTDTLFLGAVDPADVLLARTGDDLLVQFAGSADRVTVSSHFAGAAIDRIEFGRGETWGPAEISARLSVSFTEGADNVTGTDGNDAYDALGGDDTVFGLGGDDLLDGGDGNDRLDGGAGADSLRGGAGSDTLSGGAGNDALTGGAGNDVLLGGEGNDVYLFGRGDGQDTIANSDTSPAKLDALVFAADVAPADIVASRIGNDVVLTIAGSSDSVRLTAFLDNEGENTTRVDEVRFADGTVWTFEDVEKALLRGTPGNDVLYGFDRSADLIDGGAGNDTLYGRAGADTLLGGQGGDSLNGNAGDDLLDGGSGLDFLYGDDGNDILRDGERMFGGDGDDSYALSAWTQDVVVTETALGSDSLELPNGLEPARVTVRNEYNATARDYEDLVLTDGQGHRLTVPRFFEDATSAYKIEQIRFSDGTNWGVPDIFARLPYSSASESNDTIVGFRWGDVIDALGGNDSVNGMSGDDSIFGGTGADTLVGSAGSDTLDGGAGNDSLDGSFDADTLIGGSGNDLLKGGFGDDSYVLGASSGHDLIYDENGRDRVVFDASVAVSDVTLFQDRADLLIAVAGGAAQVRVKNHYGAVSFSDSPTAQLEEIRFGDGTIWSAAEIASRTVTGAPNTMTGTPGNDVFVVDNFYDTVNEAPNQGNDTVESSVGFTLPANVENLTLTGYIDIEGIGNSLDNRIVGNPGDNILRGGWNGLVGDGADTLIGGAGDDLYYADGGAFGPFGMNASQLDTVVENPGEGYDTVMLTRGPYEYTLPNNVEALVVTDPGWGSVHSDGSPYHRMAIGNALDNSIDLAIGQGGAWILDGGLGADTLRGNEGVDIYVVDNVGDVVEEPIEFGLIGPSIDTVRSTIDYALGDRIENLELIGSAPIGGAGNAQNNILDGSGNSAANLLRGGAGNDVYRVGAGDQVFENAGEGFDTVEFAYRPSDATLRVESTGASSIERFALARALGGGLTILGSDGSEEVAYSSFDRDAIGGATDGGVVDGRGGDDRLLGDSGRDTLLGGAGRDTLLGAAGADLLDGGSGDDSLDGGGGNDVYLFGIGDGQDAIGEAADGTAGRLNILRFKAGVDSSNVTAAQVGDDLVLGIGAGDDRVGVRGFFTGNNPSSVGNPIQRVEFADGTSWGLGELRAKANPNQQNASPVLATPIPDVSRVEGQALDFAIPAGTFVDPDVGDALTYSATLADGSPLPSWLSFDPDTQRFAPSFRAGAVSIRVTATDYAGLSASDTFDLRMSALGRTVMGTPGRDSLYGGAGDDTLYGLDDDDLLDGAGGRDSMVGGRGSDYYKVDDAGDVVVENAAEGSFDAIASTVSYRLPANVETLYLYGTEAISGTGNDDANLIQGNTANNRLDGGLGADTFYGGGGDDTFVVDNPGDVVPTAYGGIGTVESSVSWTLGQGLRSLVLTGAAPLNGTGNYDANVIVGNAGDNRLAGGGNADTLSGGAGNDTYVVDDLRDVIVEVAGEGVDTVESSFTWTLGNEVENLRLSGNSNVNGTGNSLGNVLTGNVAYSALSGMAGDDTLDGGAGADWLDGGSGNDTYLFARGSGADTIASFDSSPGKSDTLQLGAGIATGDIGLARVGNDLLVSIRDASGDTVRIRDHFSAPSNQIDSIRFADGSSWDAAAIQGLATVNRPPVVATPLADQSLNTGASFTFSFASNAFVDPDGDVLSYRANLAGGFALPSWMSFNALTRTFSGNTSAATPGTVSVMVTAADSAGAYVADVFDIVVRGTGRVIYGTPGNDYLAGNANDTIYAGAGNDWLYGGVGRASALYGEAGNDYLQSWGGGALIAGGPGDDYYIVDSAGDVIVEQASEGTDTIQASLDYTLPANVESLLLLGNARSGTGNTLNNSIRVDQNSTIGYTLDGYWGADTLQGGLGNDTYIVDHSGDTIFEYDAVRVDTTYVQNTSVDTVRSSTTYTLPDNIENLILTGSWTSDGTGGSRNNTIIGSDGANRLNGAGGNDTLDGGAGNDRLDGGTGSDTYLFGRGSGADTIFAFDSYDRVDTLQLTGLLPQDVVLSQESNDLLVSVNGSADSIRVQYHFTSNSTSAYRIDQMRFADGTTWNTAAIRSHVSSINLVAGSDRNEPMAVGDASFSFAPMSGARMTLDNRAQQLVDAAAWFDTPGADVETAFQPHPFTVQPILSATSAY